ncbi:MAG: alpha/beta hydrolase, partial [Jiangellaceae bacterium]
MATPAQNRRLVRGLVVLLLVTVIGVGMLAALQRQLIYFPGASRVPPAGEVIEGARDITLTTADGLELGAWFVPAAAERGSGAEMAVLVAPGNGGNRQDRVGLARELTRRGLAVLLMDYRGYAGNPGRPSEEGLAADALAAAEALEGLGFPPSRTIYFGESLGTGVVAALQARRPPAGLVLRSPFTALTDAGVHHYPWLPVRLLLRDRFPVVRY